MNVSAIKKLVEGVSVAELKQAEADLINERALQIEVEGADDGEKLTHIFAAIWILDKMNTDGLGFTTACAQYTKKLWESIK
jgi:hypothetical protein